ncbi:DUF4279 domain-containing protein [Frischella sp. Ac48]|uniref:DUF4279 domain-containing protein n=1 Tax=Frischella japonica TaxID=2741544 RepID=A0ABR7R0K0_9GAMM|nr:MULTISPECIES: DUF4279 domain-containing protein [Frischella]MBC9132008.1 DUF4279 domain-containing protein [Frischella japonica]MBX4134290.1 DUF4279 domain-containing protein [Frischella sp. Ac48]
MISINSRRTPISPEYPSCDECYAALLIYPNDIHPDKITELLKIEPTQKNIIGTKSINRIGRIKEIKTSGWFLSSKDYVISRDLREHLDWLLNKIAPCKEPLEKLQTNKNVTMGIDCVWRSLAGHGGPVIWPEQMKIMCELNLECSFDIYFVNDE